jgi:DtxR family Mn-dependent transcriptional regulator
MSDLVERRLVTLLDHPHHDPYGNPIPGLSELGEQYEEVPFLDGVQSLPSYLANRPDGGTIVLQRIAEPVQVDDEFLARLAGVGLLPGVRITAQRSGDDYVVQAVEGDEALELPDDLAKHLFVARA